MHFMLAFFQFIFLERRLADKQYVWDPFPPSHIHTYMTTQSYLIAWHLDVVSLEALRISALFHDLRTVNAFYWQQITLLQLPLGQRWTQRSSRGHTAVPKAIYQAIQRDRERFFQITHFGKKRPVHVMRSQRLQFLEGIIIWRYLCFLQFLCSGWIAWPMMEGRTLLSVMPACTAFYVSVVGWNDRGMGRRDQRSDLGIFTLFSG